MRWLSGLAILCGGALTVSAAAMPTVRELADQLLGLSPVQEESDINGDGIVNGYDLALYKRQLRNSRRQIIEISDTETLLAALQNAEAGQELVLAPGTYTGISAGSKGSWFSSGADGTADAPIVLRSKDPEHPAILSGTDLENNYVLYITGDYWRIEDLQISNAQKGIVLDNSNSSRITGCEVYNIGSEGIHLRDDSSHCEIRNCYVHDTGQVSPGYGEAIYIGSAKSTSGYGYACDDNTIIDCVLGPNVAAEHIDVKEYTSGTKILNCVFDGTGMSGMNAADSFVDIKGNDCIVMGNIGYRSGCEQIQAAFQLHVQVEGWGQNAVIRDNKMYMDVSTSSTGKTMFMADGWNSTAEVGNNYIAYEDGELFLCTAAQYHMKTYTLED